MGGGDHLELLMDEGRLRHAMWSYSYHIAWISIVISTVVATLLFFALHYMFVQPMRRITENMIAFRTDPEESDPRHRGVEPRRRDRHRRARARDDASTTSPRCSSRRAASRR